MKTRTKAPFVLYVLIAGLGLIPAGWVKAQVFTTLYSFTVGSINAGGQITNSDGAYPIAGLTLAGNTLYGTASGGGTSGKGTLFAVSTDGTGFTNLHSFAGGSDGASPWGRLVLSDNRLYGTANGGGISNRGTVFALNTDGTGFTNLYTFTAGSSSYPNITNSDGAYPIAGLTLAGNTLYGTASDGGSSGEGTVFALNTDGTGFTNLYTFTALLSNTNSDGAAPYGDLVLSGSTLFGTATGGGNSGYGTVFAVCTNGTGFTNLHSFTAGSGSYPNITNSDGADPIGSLILSGGTLYGTASQGGNSGYGTVFAVGTNGTGFTNLHSFTGSDGANPQAGLILSGSMLYGVTLGGGSFNNGTVFAVNTNGTGFTNLHSFLVYFGGGASPSRSLVLSNNTLYGTTQGGYSGTVFSISLAPRLTIIPSGPNVVLAWPTNFPGFHLQKTVNLGPPAGWTTYNLIQPPTITNGQFVVTIPNTTTDTQQYYRLSQ